MAMAATIAALATGGTRGGSSAHGGPGGVSTQQPAGDGEAGGGPARSVLGNEDTRRGSAPSRDRATATRDLGELIVARYAGLRPPPGLLRRIQERQVGGVILFGDNTAGGVSATQSAIAELQAAARRGGDLPLLIMTDQEGGDIRRLMSMPPFRAPRAMNSAATAQAEGLATGRALRRVGVNVDLAPVADVERVSGSFLGARSFGSSAQAVEQRACAFARGLSQAGVAYTLKHFPGLGEATSSTDGSPVVVDSSSPSLRADYGAYRRCGHGALALVMISSASYPNLSGTVVPAVLSPEIYRVELPRAGVRAVTISDDLDTPAIDTLRSSALRAIDAGLNLLLYAQTEASSADAYAKLLEDLRVGTLSHSRLTQAAESVRALRRSLELPVRPAN